MPVSQREAIVMGGSLGGLNAALYLRDAGFAVTVLERSAEPLAGQGAGIVLNPYTVRYFTEKQALDAAEISICTRSVRYLDRQSDVAAEIDSPYRVASYNSIYAGLLKLFGTENYHLDQRVTGFDQRGSRVRVHTVQGEELSCDLLICADGIGSDARRWLLGGTPAIYAGYIAWRGVTDTAAVSDPNADLLENAIVYHIATSGHLLTYPIPMVENSLADRRRSINWLWYRNIEKGAELDARMTDVSGKRRGLSVPPGAAREETVRQMKRDAVKVPALLNELIQQTEQPFIQAVFDYEIPQMVFGRICIMGDAAFSARPHTAAGTAKAAEDAHQLGIALQLCNNDVPAALEQWEQKQLQLGRNLVRRNEEVGSRLQNGTWPVGAPLPYGLYKQGDSLMA